ncbi:MAG: DsbA family protein [Actinomycetota bacterium]
MVDPADREFIYVGDPMCSWCWGFAPVVSELEASFDLPIRVVVGGLRPGDRAQLLDERLRSYLARHWTQIADRTGQPFDSAALDRENWIYDTMVPDAAIVTMRNVAPGETLRFFERVQRAFYAEGVDVTDPSVYRELVSGLPVDADEFVETLGSAGTQRDTYADFAEARALGVSGFPTLLLRTGDSATPVALGYSPYATVAERAHSLLEATDHRATGSLEGSTAG